MQRQFPKILKEIKFCLFGRTNHTKQRGKETICEPLLCCWDSFLFFSFFLLFLTKMISQVAKMFHTQPGCRTYDSLMSPLSVLSCTIAASTADASFAST